MSANMVLSQAVVKAGLDAKLAKLNVGGIAGVIKVFTGAAPTNCGVADSGTRLCTLTLSVTAFPASANSGVADALATANAIASDTNAANTGTAGYFRAYDSSGNCHIQGTVGTSAADMILSTISITAGQTVACTAWTVTEPSNGT